MSQSRAAKTGDPAEDFWRASQAAKRHEDDEDRALRTAIAMMKELHGFNRRRLADGKRPIDIGVGLNTDIVVSGNIGSPKRQDYTVIGDESTCRSREIDRVVVKGKTRPSRFSMWSTTTPTRPFPT